MLTSLTSAMLLILFLNQYTLLNSMEKKHTNKSTKHHYYQADIPDDVEEKPMDTTLFNTVEKKDNYFSTVPVMLDAVIKDRYKKLKNLTTKVQITLNNKAIKNPGGLIEKWQTVLERTPLIAAIHKLDSVLIAQIDVTIASKILKKLFKSQIISKTIRQIQSGKMTSPFKQLPEPPPSKNSFLATTFCSIALFSAGWLGKTWWDAGGNRQTIAVGSSILNYLMDEFIYS